MTDKYAVFGNPIKHSKSPFIHNEFASQTGQTLTYSAQLVALDEFKQTVIAFFKQGGKGANITVPFKEQAYQLCDVLSDDAKIAGAVNTLTYQADGSIRGDNTDGVGLVADLLTHCELKNKKVLLIGAGGAARGCLLPLVNAGVQCIDIYNRTTTKAQVLAQLIENKGQAVTAATIQTKYDIIINATSASLNGALPNLPSTIIGDHTVCYDMMYSKELTVFNQWCIEQGALLAIDGLGMLVGQAAKSFNIWRGILPSVDPVLKQLRHQL